MPNTPVPAAARGFPAFEPVAGKSGNDARPNLQPSLPRAFPDFSCIDIDTTAPDRLDIHTVGSPRPDILTRQPSRYHDAGTLGISQDEPVFYDTLVKPAGHLSSDPLAAIRAGLEAFLAEADSSPFPKSGEPTASET